MLEYQNVTIHRRKKKIVDNFSIRIEEGSIFGLLGSDISAKSAILQAAAGLIRPSMGRIFLNDQNILSSDTTYLETGYMSYKKQFYEQVTVEEYLEFFLALYKVNGRYRGRRVDEVLDLLEMSAYRSYFISELPSELRSFLALGQAIIHEPSWLFMDDPFGEMPVTMRKKMVDTIGMLWEGGITPVISSQPYPELMSLITELAVVEGGQMMSSGTFDSVYEEALRQSPIRMRVMSGMDEAIRVLRENPLVERVTVNGEDVILLFTGGDSEEAQLLSQLIQSGALVHHFMRDPMDLDQILWR